MVTDETLEPLAAQVQNISATGLFLTTDVAPKQGASVRCRLHLGRSPREVKGRVAWVQGLRGDGNEPRGAGAGIEFVSLSSEDSQLLQQLTTQPEGRADAAQEPLTVWFEGLPTPVKTQGLVGADEIVMTTQLPFLRIGSEVKVGLATGTASAQERYAVIDGLALDFLRPQEAPRIVVTLRTAEALGKPAPAISAFSMFRTERFVASGPGEGSSGEPKPSFGNVPAPPATPPPLANAARTTVPDTVAAAKGPAEAPPEVAGVAKRSRWGWAILPAFLAGAATAWAVIPAALPPVESLQLDPATLPVGEPSQTTPLPPQGVGAANPLPAAQNAPAPEQQLEGQGATAPGQDLQAENVAAPTLDPPSQAPTAAAAPPPPHPEATPTVAALDPQPAEAQAPEATDPAPTTPSTAAAPKSQEEVPALPRLVKGPFSFRQRPGASVVVVPIVGPSAPSQVLALSPQPGVVAILPQARLPGKPGGFVMRHPVINRVLVQARPLGVYVRVLFGKRAGSYKVEHGPGELRVIVSHN